MQTQLFNCVFLVPGLPCQPGLAASTFVPLHLLRNPTGFLSHTRHCQMSAHVLFFGFFSSTPLPEFVNQWDKSVIQEQHSDDCAITSLLLPVFLLFHSLIHKRVVSKIVPYSLYRAFSRKSDILWAWLNVEDRCTLFSALSASIHCNAP